MTVSFKAPLQSAVTNTAYVSKIADDIKTGKFTLANPAEGTTILSVQKYLNEISSNQGYTEGDVNAKVYSSTNYISNGSSQKQCIEDLDNQVFLNETAINSHIADTVDAHDASAISYDDTTSGNGQTDVQGAIDDNESRVQAIEDARGVADGYASLDSGGKVPVSELPDAVLGGPRFQATWDANTNTPDLTIVSPSQGDYWRVSTAGSTNLDGITDWGVGDWAIYNGTSFDKIDNSESVTSFNGRTGAIIPQAGDYTASDVGLGNVTNDAQLKRAAADFNSFTEKATPVDADIVLIEDSADSFNKKKVLLSNLLGGGGGGGSFAWELNGDASPLESIESGISTLDFDDISDAEMYALLTVPESYSAGDQILLQGMKYFTSVTTGNVLFKTVTQLLKANQDMSLLPITGHTDPATETTLTGSANILRDIGDLELTDSAGEVNSVAVAAGDALLVKFYRDNTNETTSAAADCKVLKYSATVKFDA